LHFHSQTKILPISNLKPTITRGTYSELEALVGSSASRKMSNSISADFVSHPTLAADTKDDKDGGDSHN
jgi:hypothetical protein